MAGVSALALQPVYSRSDAATSSQQASTAAAAARARPLPACKRAAARTEQGEAVVDSEAAEVGCEQQTVL